MDKKKDSLEERLHALEAKLEAKNLEVDEKSGDRSADSKGFALAVKLSSEFVAGIFVGALIGYVIDNFFGTSPWGLIVFLLLGFAAGVLNVLRSIGHVPQAHEKISAKQDSTK